MVSLLAAMSAACSDVPTDSAAPQAPSTEDTAPSRLAFDDSSSADSAVAPEESIDAAWVRLAMVRPASWHPHSVSIADRSAAIMADLLYDGLTVLGDEGGLEPGLAASWSSDEEVRVWTFELEERAPDAAEIVASFEALRATSLSVATEAVHDGIESIRPVGERSVEFVLTRSNGGFPWLMSALSFSVADAVGTPTGRYEVVESATEGFGLSPIDGGRGVSVRWYPNEDDAIEAVASGTADVALAGESAVRPELHRHESRQGGSRFLQVNARSAIMDDPSLRLIVAGALDLVDPDSTASSTGIVPSVVVGSRLPECSRTCVDESDEAVVAGRDLVVGGTESQRALVEAVVDQLLVAGIPAAPLVVSAQELAAQVGEGVVDIFASGWMAEAPSLDGWLPLFVDRLELGDVVTGDGTVGDLVERAMSEADDERRWAALREAELGLLRTGAVIPVSFKINEVVVGADESDVGLQPDGTLRFR